MSAPFDFSNRGSLASRIAPALIQQRVAGQQADRRFQVARSDRALQTGIRLIEAGFPVNDILPILSQQMGLLEPQGVFLQGLEKAQKAKAKRQRITSPESLGALAATGTGQLDPQTGQFGVAPEAQQELQRGREFRGQNLTPERKQEFDVRLGALIQQERSQIRGTVAQEERTLNRQVRLAASAAVSAAVVADPNIRANRAADLEKKSRDLALFKSGILSTPQGVLFRMGTELDAAGNPKELLFMSTEDRLAVLEETAKVMRKFRNQPLRKASREQMLRIQNSVMKRLRERLGRDPTDVEVAVEVGKELVDQGLQP